MSDAHPAGEPRWAPPPPGARGGAPEPGQDPALHLTDLTVGAVLEIGSWPNRLQGVAEKLADLLAADPPGRPGRFARGEGALLGWLAFGRFLWLSDEAADAERLAQAFDSEEAAVVDLGSARRGVRLTGAVAPEVLNKAVAIDFDPRAFPPGSLAQAVIDHVPVVILRRAAEEFDVIVSASLAQTVWDWLLDASFEHGYEVGEGTALVGAPRDQGLGP